MVAYHSQQPFNTVLMLGDNIYPDGNPTDLQDKFERPYAELIRRGVNFYASLGNHDVRKGRDIRSITRCFIWKDTLTIPLPKAPKLKIWWSFTRWIRPVLMASNFAGWKTRWLDRKRNGNSHSFIIRFIRQAKRTGPDTKLRSQIEPLFVKYGVAAVCRTRSCL